MVFSNITTRWHAFAAHIAISLLIFLSLLFVIVFFWYPGDFIQFGGWQGIKIVAAVDLVLGPLLTLVVFNRQKKSLKWDLSIIAAIQLGCLGYGVYAIENTRPYAQILLDDSLHVIAKSEFKERDINLKKISQISGKYPKFIILNLENDESAIRIGLSAAEITGKPYQYDTSLYLDPTKPENKEKLDWLINRLTYNTQQECYTAPAVSSFINADICLHL